MGDQLLAPPAPAADGNPLADSGSTDVDTMGVFTGMLFTFAALLTPLGSVGKAGMLLASVGRFGVFAVGVVVAVVEAAFTLNGVAGMLADMGMFGGAMGNAGVV